MLHAVCSLHHAFGTATALVVLVACAGMLQLYTHKKHIQSPVGLSHKCNAMQAQTWFLYTAPYLLRYLADVSLLARNMWGLRGILLAGLAGMLTRVVVSS